MSSNMTYEPTTAKQTLNRVRDPHMPFEWSINPYRGCQHGCSFCYARGFQGFLGREANDEFRTRIMVKENAPEALENQLARMLKQVKGSRVELRRKAGHIAIGTATDPYQPVEGKAQLTRECLKVLARYGMEVSITTRSPLILRDLDVLQELPGVSVNISISTLDVYITRNMEPATPHPRKRLETVGKLTSAGIRAGVFLAPILPLLTDDRAGMEALIREAKRYGAAFVMPSVLRLTPDVKAWYFGVLRQHYPERTAACATLFSGGSYTRRDYSERIMAMAKELLAQYGLVDTDVVSGGNMIPAYRDVCSTSTVEQLEFLF